MGEISKYCLTCRQPLQGLFPLTGWRCEKDLFLIPPRVGGSGGGGNGTKEFAENWIVDIAFFGTERVRCCYGWRKARLPKSELPHALMHKDCKPFAWNCIIGYLANTLQCTWRQVGLMWNWLLASMQERRQLPHDHVGSVPPCSRKPIWLPWVLRLENPSTTQLGSWTWGSQYIFELKFAAPGTSGIFRKIPGPTWCSQYSCVGTCILKGAGPSNSVEYLRAA